MAFQTPITIKQTIDGIQKADYVLPAIQREFVWKEEQIENLFDSLLRGYPIGSFLFWDLKPENIGEYQFYKFMDCYHERDNKHNLPINLQGRQSVRAVLDGQQRLTALNIGLRGWYSSKLPYYKWSSDHAFPKKKLYLNLKRTKSEDEELNFEFKMLRENEANKSDDDKHWFLVGDILGFTDNIMDAVGYCIKNGLTEDGDTYATDTLGKLWQVILKDQNIVYFLEEAQDLDKVLNIFVRVNSGGTILSYSDMLLSIATAQWKDIDARQEIHGLVDEINSIGEGFNFNKDFVLKSCLVLSDITNIKFKVNNFNKSNMLTIEQKWYDIKASIKLTTKLLASWGYSRGNLMSNNSLIPLAYYLFHKDVTGDFVLSQQFKDDREIMKKWLMKALLRRTFSGQSDNVLHKIRVAIRDKKDIFPADEIINKLKGSADSMIFSEDDIDALLDYRYQQAHTFTILAFLYPWLKYDQHFHMDHIYPRSLFTERSFNKFEIPEDMRGFYYEHRDSIANLQLIQGLLNQEKSDNEFEDWVSKNHSKPESLTAYRERHLIPDIDLSFNNFPDFVKQREATIKKHLKRLLEVD